MASYDFNIDILSEILSRADLKTMKKCRILSKKYNALTYESSFIQSHVQRTKTLCGYLIQGLSSNGLYSTFVSEDNPGIDDKKLRLDFLPARYVEILAVVDIGLVFCKSQHPEDQYYICKPTTQQWELIPSPNPPYPNPPYPVQKIAMIVLKSNPLWFKITRLSDDFDFCDSVFKSLDCRIFDSNTGLGNNQMI
ncbi:hypothetical protein V6N13_136535 [Hibiscus sabdariffa]|uniref:F-box domain-containing protein n=1 Tax=Hibiscus sabdariffa TaxID=183260 RepID=A0ABR2DR92_9ROSI